MLVAILRKLSSLSGKQAVGFGAVGLIFLLLGGYYLSTLVSSRGESTVILSNSKRITLGESRRSLIQDLGGQLRVDDSVHYSFISSTGGVEATLAVVEDRLVAIRVGQNGNNLQPTTGASVGKEIPLIRTKIGEALRPLPSGKILTSFYGYSWATPKTTSFYFTNPCNDDGILTGWAVAERGSEVAAVGQVKKLACNAR